MAEEQMLPPTVAISDEDAPTKKITAQQLQRLGRNLSKLFEQYESDRRFAEEKWLRNLRQILGIYDPEVERTMNSKKSRAYPRITRVKCTSVLSRLMNLMFPGNERNWTLKASPNAEMDPEDVQEAIQLAMQQGEKAGLKNQGLTEELVQQAVQDLAEARAEALSRLLDDQLQELGGDQTSDYVRLNRKVAKSGIDYGIGYLRGPYVRQKELTRWTVNPRTRQPMPLVEREFKPQFEFMPVWDVYIDMSARTPEEADGYFLRFVMSKSQVRRLADRDDFFENMVKEIIKRHPRGNYRPKGFETSLKNMGVAENVKATEEPPIGKFEVLAYHGPVDAKQLIEAGVDVPEDKRADEIDAEVWMIEGQVIKADINAWAKLGVEMRQLHSFVFDEDDTSPLGNGMPDAMRDSQMAISAASRMLLDNASVTCGPNLEANLDLLVNDQDLTTIEADKIWYREGTGADANVPALRPVSINSHVPELLNIISTFREFADDETFVGPATGGDMERGYSEPMRTAAGASMLRGDAALPFKDIVRNYDAFTQSLIQSMVLFNRKFNPEKTPEADYNIIARGATSLIAKEIRGIQIDQLSATLTPDERMYVDDRKLVEQKFKTRDLEDMLVSPAIAERRLQARQEQQAAEDERREEMVKAEIRKTLSDAFKNITQGQKNSAAADAEMVQAALSVLVEGGKLDLEEQKVIEASAARRESGPASQSQGEPRSSGAA